MRENRFSRRTIVYAILLMAVFVLLALVVSGCTTPEATSDDSNIDSSAVRVQFLNLGPDDGYEGDTVRDAGKRLRCYKTRPLCPVCAAGRCAHGRGTLWTDGGVWYKGDFSLGVMHGTGTYEDDEIEYVGGFRYGIPHGPGTMKCYDGTKYKGNFSDAMLVGQFRVITRRGTSKSMQFSGRDARSGPIVSHSAVSWKGPYGPCYD